MNGDRSFCFVCKEILREAGYRPALSFEAGEAWERLGREHFDLVLWDLDLPGMPGVDLIEWEPRSPLSGGRLPAIFLSVHGPGEARTRKGRLPAACLSKPIDFPVLLEKIHEALGSPAGLFGEKGA
ncbi:MAG: response regulator [Nitrospirae bacterium]|nr:response regulator [Nitrospirota bacterium]